MFSVKILIEKFRRFCLLSAVDEYYGYLLSYKYELDFDSLVLHFRWTILCMHAYWFFTYEFFFSTSREYKTVDDIGAFKMTLKEHRSMWNRARRVQDFWTRTRLIKICQTRIRTRLIKICQTRTRTRNRYFFTCLTFEKFFFSVYIWWSLQKLRISSFPLICMDD